MNNKTKKFVLLQILNQIQQDNVDARDDINKSSAAICKEEGISLEQVFYTLFLMLSLSAINHPLVYILATARLLIREFIQVN